MGILSASAGFQQLVLMSLLPFEWPVGTPSNSVPQKTPFYKGEPFLSIGR